MKPEDLLKNAFVLPFGKISVYSYASWLKELTGYFCKIHFGFVQGLKI